MRGICNGLCILIIVLLPVASVEAQQIQPASQSAQSATNRAEKSRRALAQSAPASGEPSETAADATATRLPVRRVVLYKTGVGYFEHLGEVHGDQTVAIHFTSGQLNDVLQSLTVLDLNGGRIAGIDYNSEAPLAQRLDTLGLPLGEKTTLSQFLAALRGTRVEIRNGNSTISGRLLSVERQTRVTGTTSLEVDVVTVVSDDGEVRTVEVTPAVSVRLADHGVDEEVGRYLFLLASERQQDLRQMNITTAGAGDRQLYVSYISEVPIWKTTYRIVLPAKSGDEPLLQGWAIVDNTVGEDWDNVELSLIAGAPQSFIQQLSQPYYGRRPVVPLPENYQLTPQTHEGAMLGGAGGLSGVVTDQSGAVISGAQVKIYTEGGQQVAETATDNRGRYEFADLPAANYHVEFSSPGFQRTIIQGLSLGGGRVQEQSVTLDVGNAAETVDVTAAPPNLQSPSAGVAGNLAAKAASANEPGGLDRRDMVGAPRFAAAPPPPPMPAEEMLAQARQQAESAAQGENLGDLFEYKLKDRVTIHKNESALVPIVQAHVAAEKVSLWNPSLNSERPLRALWLTNSSPLTLDGGSFTVLENETFAGEGLTESIKPGEKRLLSYAADLGVRVDAKSESEPQRVTRVRIIRGVMMQTRELRQSTTYTIRDDDTTPRTILIEHPLRAGWKLGDDVPKPEETTSNVYRFKVSVSPKKTAILKVDEAEPLVTRYEISNLSDDQITLFLAQKTINPEIESALRKIVEQKNKVSALENQLSTLNEEKQSIFNDQQRLRENLKALKGTPEERALTERYVQQLADQENRLQALQKEAADLRTRRDQAQADLNAMIENLSMDTTL